MSRTHRSTCPLLLLGFCLKVVVGMAAPAPEILAATRAGDRARVAALLEASPGAVTARDERGNTALHWAALANDTRLVKRLLAAGAEVGATNQAGATPLHYGTGDARIVRDLLRAGADPNARSQAGVQPLHTAAARPVSLGAAKLLLAAGADRDAIRPAGQTPLTLAAFFGDARTVRLLLDRGTDPGVTQGFTPVAAAAYTGRRNLLEEILQHGGRVNDDDGFAGHALNAAFYAGHQDLVPSLIRQGADLEQASTFGEQVPPMVMATYNETGDPAMARALVARGVNVNALTSADHTALDWALRRGETPLVAFLRAQGATNGAPPAPAKELPRRAIPTDELTRKAMLRDAVERAVGLLQQSSDAFLANAFVRESGCVSCHHQTLPAWAFGRARERGFDLDEASLARQLHVQRASWSRRPGAGYELFEPVPDGPANLGYGLLGWDHLGYAPDELTEEMVWYLAAAQLENGSFPSYDRRPPMEEGQVIGTALAVGALRAYPQPVAGVDLDRQCERARRWLRQVKPRDPNQQAFRLLGLAWAGERPTTLKKLAGELLATQRADGGWAPLPTLPSDGWATGLTLYALHEAGVLAAPDPAHRRGTDYLLRTQFEDGSWWVASRTWPFQPHFDSAFPHGKDQWISAGATAWAVLALLNELPPTIDQKQLPSAQTLMARHPVPESSPAETTAHPEVAGTVSGAAEAAFARDVRPLLETSCAGCHGGDKPKGGFRVGTVTDLLRGGQSGEPAVIPGQPDASPLVRLVTDQVEDLEMPPLGKRGKYPALTPGEVDHLKACIASLNP